MEGSVGRAVFYFVYFSFFSVPFITSPRPSRLGKGAARGCFCLIRYVTSSIRARIEGRGGPRGLHEGKRNSVGLQRQ